MGIKALQTIFLGLLGGIFFAVPLASAQADLGPYDDLDEVLKAEFIRHLKYLYVLGSEDPAAEAPGVLSVQTERLQRVKQIVDEVAGLSPELLHEQMRQIYFLDQAVTDWLHDFRFGLGLDEPQIARIYEQLLERIPTLEKRNFDTLIARMKIEIQFRIHSLQFPVIREAMILPGLWGSSFTHYLESFPESPYHQLPPDILHKIREKAVLSPEEYSKIWTLQVDDPENQVAFLFAYLRYRGFGNLQTDYKIRSLTRDLFEGYLDDAVIATKAFAEEFSIDPSILDQIQFGSKTREFLWQIYSTSFEIQWSPDWDLSWKKIKSKTANIRGFPWVIENFQDRWPPFVKFDPENQSLEDRFFYEIDTMMEENFYQDVDYFRASYEQIFNGDWVHLDAQSFAYYRLSNELRLLLGARLFPDLTTLEASTLIEKRFFELGPDEQMSLMNRIYPDLEGSLRYAKMLGDIDLSSVKDRNAWHKQLVNDYLNTNDEIHLDDVKFRVLLDGKTSVRDVEFERNRTKQFIQKAAQENEDLLQDWFPSGLVNWLQIQFFPYENFWEEEGLRYSDQQRREKLTRTNLHELQELDKKYKEEKSEAGRLKILKEIQTLMAGFNQNISQASPDYSSPSVYLSGFVYGALPHDRNDLARIAKSIGTGFLFFTITRYIGGKEVAIFILGDTGLRILSSRFLADGDLESGFSSPLGLWTAEFLQSALQIGGRVLTGVDSERLSGYRELGQLSADLAWFSTGSLLSHKIFPYQRIWAQRKIEKLRWQIDAHQELIVRSRMKISELEGQIERKKAELTGDKTALEGTTAFTERRLEIAGLERQKRILLDGEIQYQGRAEFFIRQTGDLSLQIAKKFMPLTWIKPKGYGVELMSRSRGIFRRFDRLSQFGIKQLEEHIEYLRRNIERTETRGFTFEARPAESLEYEVFKTTLKDLRKQQEMIGRNRRNIERALEAKNYDRATSALRTAALAFESSARNMDLLLDAGKRPKTLSVREQFLYRFEPYRKVFSLFPRRRTNTILEPLEDAWSRRFFARSYLRLSEQKRLLQSMSQDLADGIRRQELPRSPQMIEDLEMIGLILRKVEIRLKELKPLFDIWISN